MYIQITELATPTSSRLLSPFLDKRDKSEEQVAIMVLAPTDRSFFIKILQRKPLPTLVGWGSSNCDKSLFPKYIAFLII